MGHTSYGSPTLWLGARAIVAEIALKMKTRICIQSNGLMDFICMHASFHFLFMRNRCSSIKSLLEVLAIDLSQRLRPSIWVVKETSLAKVLSTKCLVFLYLSLPTRVGTQSSIRSPNLSVASFTRCLFAGRTSHTTWLHQLPKSERF